MAAKCRLIFTIHSPGGVYSSFGIFLRNRVLQILTRGPSSCASLCLASILEEISDI